MNPAEMDREIAMRRKAISRAERTIADAQGALYRSEPTMLALRELVLVVAAEQTVLDRLKQYRVGLIPTA